jgi:hypothetical protein
MLEEDTKVFTAFLDFGVIGVEPSRLPSCWINSARLADRHVLQLSIAFNRAANPTWAESFVTKK